MYEIVIDSTCGLPKDLRLKYGLYEDYLHGIIYLPKGEYATDLEFEEYSQKEYFSIIKKNAGKIKTAFSSYDEFSRVIEPILKDGKDVILPVISTGLSGTYNGFIQFAKIMLEDYPNRKIEVIDTLKYGPAAGLLCIYAGINKINGMSFEDNVNWLNKKRYELHQIGVLDDLSFLAKSGRLSATKAFFGQLVGIQAIADFTYDGKTTPLGTVKGSKSANSLSLKYLKQTIVKPEEQIIFVCHSNRYERAKIFAKQLQSEIVAKDVVIISVDESCGPNIGPGLCAYFYFGVPLSKDREPETNLFNKLKESI